MVHKLILVFLLIGSVVYVYFSTSYRLGRKAQDALNKGAFKEAYTLATQALEEDPYNRLAFSVQNQAKQRKNIQEFLHITQENLNTAMQILEHIPLSAQEFLTLQWMVETFNKTYRNLLLLNQPNTQEKKQLQEYAQWFKQLEDRLKEAQ